MKAWRLSCLTAVCAALVLGCNLAWAKDPPRAAQMLLAQNQSPQRPPDVPYVPTIDEVVAEMLKLGQVDKSDFVIDLGSGDGRIPITAAKKFGAHGYEGASPVDDRHRVAFEEFAYATERAGQQHVPRSQMHVVHEADLWFARPQRREERHAVEDVDDAVAGAHAPGDLVER